MSTSSETFKSKTYSNAQAHSRRVRFVKRLLPVFAIIAVGGIATSMFSSRIAPDVAIDLPDSTISDGKLVMANPNLDGFTKDDRPYSVTATRAIQDLKDQTALELETLRAEVELKDGQVAVLTSDTGTFNSEANTLKLPNNATLKMSGGMVAQMGEADIDIQSGDVLASQSVKIVDSLTTITSQSMIIEDGGKRIVFDEKVRLVRNGNALDNTAHTNQVPASNAGNTTTN